MPLLFSFLRRALPALALAFLTCGCDVDGALDAVEDFKIVIALEPVETVVAGRLLDAATGELIAGEATLTFAGADGGAVIDLYSDPLPRQEVRGGVASFGIRNELAPTAADPVQLVVQAAAPGYRPGSIALDLTSEGEHTFALYLASEAAPAGAAASAEATVLADAKGALVQSAALSTPGVGAAGARAALSVRAGAAVRDGASAAVSGAIRVRLTVFDAGAPEVTRAFPASGALEGGGYLAAAAQARLELTGPGGRRADAPLALTLEIPAGARRPETGAPLKAGDAIGLFRYDEAAALWRPAGESRLEAGAPGVLRAAFEAAGAGLWAAGWRAAECAAGATLRVNRNGNGGALDVAVYGLGFYRAATIPDGKSETTLRRMPRGLPARAQVAGYRAAADLADGCAGTYTLDLPAPTAPKIDVRVVVEPVCPSPDQGVRIKSIPVFVLLYRKTNAAQGDPWLTAGAPSWVYDEAAHRLVRGELLVRGLEMGASYTVKTTFAGETYSRNATVTGPEMVIKENIKGDYCQ